MDIFTLVNMTSRAWALSILGMLHIGVAGRQAALIKATGASRTAFAQSMEHLIKIGLVERNPGHGHPLRPEFRLTMEGKAAAAIAHQIYRATHDTDQDLIRRSWTVPILFSLEAPLHFNDIKRSLNMITDRALSQSLKLMEERDWVERGITTTTRPPRSLYSAINTGEKISRVLAADLKAH